jgi:transcription initiation factor TFIID subunit 11
MDTMSIVSGSIANGKLKKKPRKMKGGSKEERGKSMGSGDGKKRSREMTEEPDDEEEGGEELALESAVASKEEKAREDRKRQVLVRAFEGDDDQFRRYEAWRSSKLNDAVVRRVSTFSFLIFRLY